MPGNDLKKEIILLVKKSKIKAGVVICGVGSLSKVILRMPVVKGKVNIKKIKGDHEIISMIGTLSLDGVHIHMSVSDKSGKVTGGHLIDGNIVKTTVELVIAVFSDVKYRRLPDKKTGFDELSVLCKV